MIRAVADERGTESLEVDVTPGDHVDFDAAERLVAGDRGACDPAFGTPDRRVRDGDRGAVRVEERRAGATVSRATASRDARPAGTGEDM